MDGLTPLLYDFSEDKEKRAERFEESERGWMMLFLVSRPKLTERIEKEREKNECNYNPVFIFHNFTL